MRKKLALLALLTASLLTSQSSDDIPIPHCYPCEPHPTVVCHVEWYYLCFWGACVFVPIQVCEEVYL